MCTGACEKPGSGKQPLVVVVGRTKNHRLEHRILFLWFQVVKQPSPLVSRVFPVTFFTRG